MISVVIPMYNSKDTITRCIRSVMAQSEYDLIREIIVVDDGSTDGSAGLVARQYGSCQKLRLIRKKNEGVSSARNAGIRAAASEWIAFLDSDDLWTKNKIRMQWEVVTAHPEISFIGTNRKNENIRWGRLYDAGRKIYYLDLKHILLKNWPHTSTAMIKKDLFSVTGLYDENMRYAEDGNMWNKVALAGGIYYLAGVYASTGGNKLSFGESGLSADLCEMYRGNLKNIRELRQSRDITAFFYVFLRFYYWIKQIRRMIITKWVQMVRRKK